MKAAQAYFPVILFQIFQSVVKNPKCGPFKWKLQRLFSCGSVSNVNVWLLNEWPFKEKAVVLRMKATKPAYFPMLLFQTFDSMDNWPQLRDHSKKSHECVFSCGTVDDSYKGVLSYGHGIVSNFSVSGWNSNERRCLIWYCFKIVIPWMKS